MNKEKFIELFRSWFNIQSKDYIWSNRRKDLSEDQKNIFKEMYKHLEEVINLRSLSLKDAQLLGMRKWERKTGEKCLYLFPLYLYPLIIKCKDLEVYSIDYEKYIIGKDSISDDTRLGLLAYGLFFDEKRGKRND